MRWSWSWFAKDSISPAAFVRCSLQGPQDWTVRSGPNRFDYVVVDTKVIDRITDHERGLMLNYLRITNLRDGRHPQFQASQIGMGANCFMSSRPLMFQEGFVTSCSFVSIRG